MKTLVWTGVWLAAAVSSLAAQQSYVWVANGPGSSVTIHAPGGATVTTLIGALYNFSQPYDIVAVPGYRKMVVSNNGSNSLSVIDADTLALVTSIPMGGAPLNASNLRGMSVSGDGEFVFVAAEHSGNPGVYQLQMSDLTVSFVAEIVDAANFAEDCVVVNASQVGGTGNGPGKIYFSVPGGNYVGVIRVDPPGATTSISIGATSPLPAIGTPTKLERTPDHAVVFGACTTIVGTNFQILRIATGAVDTATAPTVFTDTINKTNQILDIAFRPGSPARGYVISTDTISTPEVRDIDATGVAVVTVPAARPAFNTADRIRFDEYSQQLLVGERFGTSSQYGRMSTVGQPVGVVQMATSTSQPLAFAFSLPTLRVDSISPRGQVTTATSVVHIFGSGFDPSATVQVTNGGAPVGIGSTFVDPGHLIADVSGLANDLWSIIVTNPGPLATRLTGHYLAIGPPGLAPSFQVTLPSRFQGYQMLSFPQFGTVADVRNAVFTQFGGYNPSFVRIFVQNGGGYKELTGVAAADLFDLSGRSFWAITRYGSTLSLSASAVSSNTVAVGNVERVIPVNPGWNMISQPHLTGANGRMALGNIEVYSDGDLGNLQGSLAAVATAGITSFPAEYLGGSYVSLMPADLMVAGKGYWLRNNTARPLYLLFRSNLAVLKTIPSAAMTVAPVVGLTAADLTPPAPPESVTEEDSDSSGCGALGLEALLALAFLRAARRRRLAG